MDTVLIVDDDPTTLRLLGELLKGRYDVAIARDGAEAIRLAGHITPDLILLDVVMPDLNGYEVCRRITSRIETRDIPVIFIAGSGDTEHIIEGFRAGGRDYIAKPVNPEELLVRVKTHIELKRTREELGHFADQLKRKNRALSRALDRLRELSMIDDLTHVYNRRYMTSRMRSEAGRITRHHETMALLIVDIDNFKSINDTYGHNCGDTVIRHVARTMSRLLRPEDTVARWGGEEFLILLPQTHLHGATATAEKIRRILAKESVSWENVAVAITVTIGVAEYAPRISMNDNIRRADDALYEGKATGKNRVVAAADVDAVVPDTVGLSVEKPYRRHTPTRR